jgi:dienelactone hydrolase
MKKALALAARAVALSLIAFSFLACSSSVSPDAELNPSETFSDADKPESFSIESREVTGPWGYDKNENGDRLYPLVVSGYWGEGAGEYAKVNARYPAFVIDYQKNGESDGEALAVWIDKAIAAGYRIDPERIYLTGFSMGASGSFPLARGMSNKGKYFAAIVRVAGQSESDLGNEIAAKTAVWYHIGLEDDATRIDVARAALALNRAYACNKSAKESTSADSVTGYQRTTVTLNRSGYEMFKYSEYVGMGHDPSPCYRDENLFPWVFSHSLSAR